MRTAYWWRRVPNFGDELNWMISQKMSVDIDWMPPDQAELVMVGSVLEHLPDNWSGTVCGAGLLRPASRIDLTHARILALRGHLTADRVTGNLDTTVLGDPGLLAPRFIPQPIAKYELGVVPHWSDTELRDRFPHAHFIDVRKPPNEVIAEIARCQRVISSSLHGLIVADAYGIPRQAELFAQAQHEGGDFKFRDYQSIYGDTDPHFGEMWTAPHDVVEHVQDDLWAAIHVGFGRPRPADKVPLPTVESAPAPDVDAGSWWSNLWYFITHGHWPPPAPTPVAHRPQVSLLVPFRDNSEHRARVWAWLHTFWASHLTDCEIIMGADNGFPFSKARAVNRAAAQARGRVFVILDADALMDPADLQAIVDQIDDAVSAGRRLWFMPYDHLYRLTEAATLDIIRGIPTAPFSVPIPPPDPWVETVNTTTYGHQYGAMIQVMPREAFYAVGGMDPRFRGWGSEDAAMLRSLDTLYAPHQVAHNGVLHLWHSRPGNDYQTRRWVGQNMQTNTRLAQRYKAATGEPGYMRTLINERAPMKGL